MRAIESFGKELNALIVSMYQSVGKLEDAMLYDLSNGRITIGEMHTIECIGARGDAGISVTEIAQEMKITLPSVTAAVKKLEKKGLVTKTRSTSDARQVVIRLTEEGRRADIAHRYFHRKMIRAVSCSIPLEERPVLLQAMRRINDFIENRLEELENPPSGERG